MKVLEWWLSGVRVRLFGMTNPHTGEMRPLTDRDIADTIRRAREVGGVQPTWIERTLLEGDHGGRGDRGGP